MCVARWTIGAAAAALLVFLPPVADVLLARVQPPAVAGREFTHVVKTGETWQSIGSRFAIEPTVLAALNEATLKSPLKTGTTLQVDSRHLVPTALESGVVINVPQRMLFLKSNGEMVAAYPVGLGRASRPTFIGPFTVVASETDPVWDVPPSIQEELRLAGKKVITRVLPGPTNPLGKYWLGLSAANYGIHGTIAPRSIYRFESHGCIRLHPDDIADLWPRVPVGTAGEIVYETWLLAVLPDGAILLEAHRDVYSREAGDVEDAVRTRAQDLGIESRIDWEAVTSTLDARDGRPRHVARHP